MALSEIIYFLIIDILLNSSCDYLVLFSVKINLKSFQNPLTKSQKAQYVYRKGKKYHNGKETTDMGYMRTATVYINEGHPLFKYADNLTALTNSLSNAARFRQRQVLSAVSRKLTGQPTSARLWEIRKTVPLREKASMPTKRKAFLGYMFLGGSCG